METVEQKKQLLTRMMRDIVNVKVQIKMLQSKKMKGIQKDEFGEDIDEKIEELKEFLQMIIEAYVAVFESSQNGELTKEGGDIMRQMGGNESMKSDACLNKMLQDTHIINKAMEEKCNLFNKINARSLNENRVHKNVKFEKEKPEKKRVVGGLKPVLKKSDDVKANGNLVHVKASATQPKPQPANQRAMGKNQRAMTAPQMGRF